MQRFFLLVLCHGRLFIFFFWFPNVKCEWFDILWVMCDVLWNICCCFCGVLGRSVWNIADQLGCQGEIMQISLFFLEFLIFFSKHTTIANIASRMCPNRILKFHQKKTHLEARFTLPAISHIQLCHSGTEDYAQAGSRFGLQRRLFDKLPHAGQHGIGRGTRLPFNT